MHHHVTGLEVSHEPAAVVLLVETGQIGGQGHGSAEFAGLLKLDVAVVRAFEVDEWSTFDRGIAEWGPEREQAVCALAQVDQVVVSLGRRADA